MTIFKISCTNLRRNFEQYLIYFVSVTVSVLIFFTFLSLADNPLLIATFKRWDVFGPSLFSSAAFLLLLFITFFIFYSNGYFIRRRKREFGLYSLLGLRKKQIIQMVLFENLFMYLLALALGIFMGIFFSKLFTMLLFWAVNLHVNTVLIISFKAIWETIIIFFFLLLIITMYSAFFIYRNRLISLFRIDLKALKPVKGSLILTVLGAVLIISGYWLALRNIEESPLWLQIGAEFGVLAVLGSVIFGTWLLFRFGLPYFVRLFYNRPRFAYKGTNLVTVTLLRYRLKKNVTTLAMNAVMSATTLTIISLMSSSYYVYINKSSYENPASYQILDLSPEKQKLVESVIDENEEHRLLYKVNTEFIDLTISNPLKQMPYEMWARDNVASIMSSSNFNKLSQLEGRDNRKVTSLRKGEAVYVGESSYNAPKKEQASWQHKTFHLTNEENKKVGFINIVGFRQYQVLHAIYADSLVVVNDNYYKELKKATKPTYVTVYDVNNSEHMEDLDKAIQVAVQGKFDIWSGDISSAFSNYHLISILLGTMLYIGTFVGIVFFLATGSVIYFKQVIDAYEEKARFETLLRLGLTKKEMCLIIARQIRPLFVIPLLFGIAHSLAAIDSFSLTFGYAVNVPVFIVIMIYCLFYMVYYILFVKNYTKIVMRDYS